MQKIISLFVRSYDGDRLVRDEIVPGAEWVVAGEGVATRKYDGTSCLVRDGRLYKRYDAKKGKTPPAGFEPAQDNNIRCVTCRCVVQYPEGGNADAAQESRGTQAVQERLLSAASRSRPGISAGDEPGQEHPRPDVRTLPGTIQGAKGQEVLQPQLLNEVAVGQPGQDAGEAHETGQASRGSRDEEAAQDEGGLYHGLVPGSSEGRTASRLHPGTSAGNGDPLGSSVGVVGTRPSSERDKGRQPSRKPGDSDPREASRYGYLSALPESISASLIVPNITCPNCGGLVTYCVAPDPFTLHWPGWLPVGDGPEDRWHREALANWPMPEFAGNGPPPDGTYELIGPKVQGGVEGWPYHTLAPHGANVLQDAPCTFAALKLYLSGGDMEGIVWHHHDGRMCKIKAKDFGIRWPRR